MIFFLRIKGVLVGSNKTFFEIITVEEPAKVEEAKEKSEDLIGEEGPAIELKENLPDIVQVNTGEENEDVNNLLLLKYLFFF